MKLSVHELPEGFEMPAAVPMPEDRRPSASDIDPDDLLRFIHERSMAPMPSAPHPVFGPSKHTPLLPAWVCVWDFETSPWREWPTKVIWAKLERLANMGFLSGCSCGCRGDWELTDGGYARLGVRDPRWDALMREARPDVDEEDLQDWWEVGIGRDLRETRPVMPSPPDCPKTA